MTGESWWVKSPGLLPLECFNTELHIVRCLSASPVSFSSSCSRRYLVRQHTCVGFLPFFVSLPHSAPTVSWDHLPNKLLALRSLFQSCFWEDLNSVSPWPETLPGQLPGQVFLHPGYEGNNDWSQPVALKPHHHKTLSPYSIPRPPGNLLIMTWLPLWFFYRKKKGVVTRSSKCLVPKFYIFIGNKHPASDLPNKLLRAWTMKPCSEWEGTPLSIREIAFPCLLRCEPDSGPRWLLQVMAAF